MGYTADFIAERSPIIAEKKLMIEPNNFWMLNLLTKNLYLSQFILYSVPFPLNAVRTKLKIRKCLQSIKIRQIIVQDIWMVLLLFPNLPPMITRIHCLQIKIPDITLSQGQEHNPKVLVLQWMTSSSDLKAPFWIRRLKIKILLYIPRRSNVLKWRKASFL